MARQTFVFFAGEPNRLEVWNWFGIEGDYDYPMTYTIRECVEEYCAQRDFCLIYFKEGDEEMAEDNMASGVFKYVRF